MTMDAIPEWKLERYLLGELQAEDEARVRAALEADVAQRERLEALRRSNTEILAAHPATRVAETIRRRARPSPRWTVAPALVLAGLIAALLYVPSEQGPEPTRSKGLAPRLVVYRQVPVSPERLQDGARLPPREVLQLAYVAAGRPYGALVSVDGRGEVTVHLESQPLSLAGEVPLPRAFELDDAPRFERFFFVTHSEPFELSKVTSAAQAAAAAGALPSTLSLPEGFEQTAFTIEKVTP